MVLEKHTLLRLFSAPSCVTQPNRNKPIYLVCNKTTPRAALVDGNSAARGNGKGLMQLGKAGVLCFPLCLVICCTLIIVYQGGVFGRLKNAVQPAGERTGVLARPALYNTMLQHSNQHTIPVVTSTQRTVYVARIVHHWSRWLHGCRGWRLCIHGKRSSRDRPRCIRHAVLHHAMRTGLLYS